MREGWREEQRWNETAKFRIMPSAKGIFTIKVSGKSNTA